MEFYEGLYFSLSISVSLVNFGKLRAELELGDCLIMRVHRTVENAESWLVVSAGWHS